MDEVTIDVDKASAVGLFVNEVIVPDLVVECARF
jgi:hypothetical protein